MKRLLIAYATMAGSTAEIAETIGGELTVQGFAVEVKPVEAIAGLQSYDAVIIGAPMILGWHRAALRFLRRHERISRAFRWRPLSRP